MVTIGPQPSWSTLIYKCDNHLKLTCRLSKNRLEDRCSALALIGNPNYNLKTTEQIQDQGSIA